LERKISWTGYFPVFWTKHPQSPGLDTFQPSILDISLLLMVSNYILVYYEYLSTFFIVSLSYKFILSGPIFQ